MALYLIDYDLCDPGQHYEKLIEEIKKMSWAKICKSSWAVKTNLTSAQIREKLTPYIDKNDKLFVAQFNGWASLNLPKNVTDWLKQ